MFVAQGGITAAIHRSDILEHIVRSQVRFDHLVKLDQLVQVVRLVRLVQLVELIEFGKDK